MSTMTTNASMADVIAREIRRHRQARGLTVKQLADECARLGAKQLTATALTNVERGQGEPGKGGRPRTSDTTPRRRRDVSHDELLVVARALGVPPAALLFPLGANEKVEVLPGHQASAWDAYRWFAGLDPFPGRLVNGHVLTDVEDLSTWQTGAALITMRLEHDRLVDAWHRATTSAANSRRHAEAAVSVDGRADFARRADQATREAATLEEQLAEHRRAMRGREVTPEPLPTALAHVDDVPPPPPPVTTGGASNVAKWALLAQTLGADQEALAAATDPTEQAALRERVEGHERRLREYEEGWRQYRQEQRRQGVTPPPLPGALSYIDE